jgi:TRAP transporter TAXI family solute receptor
MATLEPRKIGLVALTVATAMVIGIAGAMAWQAETTRHVTIAAGPSKEESFVLMQALKTVVERHYPRLKVAVRETSDTRDTLGRLERDEAQFAVAQSDADPGSSARVVAVLFEDTFQVLANSGTGISRFLDLKGKRVALTTRGAQFRTFLFVAQYYGLTSTDFIFVGQDDETADLAFVTKTADAIFRVRAIHDPGIERLANSSSVSFIPIDEAAGIHIQVPSYSPTVIPKGAYLGNPPIPAADIPTVTARHTLLARQDLDDDVVQAFTEVLMEHRPEMAAVFPRDRAELLPLLGEVRQPTEAMGLGLGVHPGAQVQYGRGNVPFVRRHADVLAAILAGFGLVGLWMWTIRLSIHRRQRTRLSAHIQHLHDLMEEIEIATTDRQATPIRAELVRVLRMVIREFEQEKISARNLRSFEVVWRAAFVAARERRAAIRKFSGTVQPPPEPRTVAPSNWSFAKLLLSKLR